MIKSIVPLAKKIYRATPVAGLRRFYFSAFCRAVRGRRIQATIDDLRFDLDLGEMIDVAVLVQEYEPEVTAALYRFCKPGMVALDIGANIGAHTLRMARLVTNTGLVVAFEPTDYAFVKLTRNVALNELPNVRTVHAALSNRSLHNQRVGYRASWRTDGRRSDSAATIVDFVRLDDWCDTNEIRAVDLIKIDVDGNEFDVLDGGLNAIARWRPLFLMEAVGLHFARDDRNPFFLLRDLGYRFWNAKSQLEYTSLVDLAGQFPSDDMMMKTSINLLARWDLQ